MRTKYDPPLLEFRNITVIKGGNKRILDSVSVTIDQGENVAILGPNGAGKSSLIKTITRQYYPFPGEKGFYFRLLGEELWNVFSLRFLLGIVSNDLQNFFDRDITGMDTVLSGFFSSIGLYREKVSAKMKRKAEEIIGFLGLESLKHRLISEMSSGEARRFLIGRALVHDPKALILDEPTNSLDIRSLYKFSDTLRRISGAGVSVILVTQNLYDIIPEIKRVILMKEGRIYKDGAKDKILNNANMSALFGVSLEIKVKKGYYYALRA